MPKPIGALQPHRSLVALPPMVTSPAPRTPGMRHASSMPQLKTLPSRQSPMRRSPSKLKIAAEKIGLVGSSPPRSPTSPPGSPTSRPGTSPQRNPWEPPVSNIEFTKSNISFSGHIELEPFEKEYLEANEAKLQYKIAMPAEEEYTSRFAFTGSDVVKTEEKRSGKLYSWLGVPGSRVGNSVAPSFALPDGRILRFFHASKRRNARTPYLESAEILPETLAGLGMQRLPSRPSPPIPNERDMPRITRKVTLEPPLPVKSLLEQTNPPPSYGEIIQEPFTVLASQHVEVSKDNDSAAAPAVEEAPPFRLVESVFAERRTQSDGHSFFTTSKITERAFQIDWSRCNSPHFRQLIGKEDNEGLLHADIELGEIRDAMYENHTIIYTAYTYYCAIRDEGDGYAMGLFAFFTFLRDCRLIDNDSKFCNSRAYESIFLAANVEEKANTVEQRELNRANDDCSLMRFEFMQCLVRLAIAKYVRDKDAANRIPDVSDAVREIMNVDVIPNLPTEANRDVNIFRRKRLYTRAVHKVFARYKTALETVFNFYANAEGREMSMKEQALTLNSFEFFTLLNDCNLLVEEHTDVIKTPVGLTPLQARLTLMWSQSFVSDELKRRQAFVSATYVDFLEIIGRMCTFLDMPTREMLVSYGARSAKEFYDHIIQGKHDGGVLNKTSVTMLGESEELAKTGYYWKSEEASDELLEDNLEMLITLILDRLDDGGDGFIDRADLAKRRMKTLQKQEEMLMKRGSSIKDMVG